MDIIAPAAKAATAAAQRRRRVAWCLAWAAEMMHLVQRIGPIVVTCLMLAVAFAGALGAEMLRLGATYLVIEHGALWACSDRPGTPGVPESYEQDCDQLLP